jgi:acyl-CoA reductase-like NAD-dependent aldehyde dehydrogenase
MAAAEQTLAPTEAKPDTSSEKRPARMLIDGAWVDSLSGAFLSVENPAKRCPVGEVPRGDAADVNGAVEAAARAFPAWSKVAPRDRGRLLLHIADTLETRSEELARTIALETGNSGAA